jgi:hypothetical protein
MKICYFIFKNRANLVNLFEIGDKNCAKNYSRQNIMNIVFITSIQYKHNMPPNDTSNA